MLPVPAVFCAVRFPSSGIPNIPLDLLQRLFVFSGNCRRISAEESAKVEPLKRRNSFPQFIMANAQFLCAPFQSIQFIKKSLLPLCRSLF